MALGRGLAATTAEPAQTGVWIGVATISMSFAAFTSALVVRQSGATDWQHFELPPLLYVNTLILLASSGTLEWSRRSIARTLQQATPGVPRALLLPSQAVSGLYVTLALGLMFLSGQVLAWRGLARQGLFLSTSPNSSFFYVFTALHGLHVLGGIAGLSYVLHRLTRAGGPVPTGSLGAAALYWHFMDALWLYLLLILTTRV